MLSNVRRPKFAVGSSCHDDDVFSELIDCNQCGPGQRFWGAAESGSRYPLRLQTIHVGCSITVHAQTPYHRNGCSLPRRSYSLVCSFSSKTFEQICCRNRLTGTREVFQPRDIINVERPDDNHPGSSSRHKCE